MKKGRRGGIRKLEDAGIAGQLHLKVQDIPPQLALVHKIFLEESNLLQLQCTGPGSGPDDIIER